MSDRYLKIGAILPHLKVFGGVRRYIELGNALVSRGHEYVIYTPEGNGCTWIEFKGDVRRLDELKDSRHDVVMTGSPEFFDVLLRSGASLKVFYLQIEGVKDERRIVKNRDIRVMVNSTGLARRIERRYHVEPLDGIGGVNTSMFKPIDPDEKDGESVRLGISRSRPVRIICYGRLSRPRKGTRFVAGAARMLRRAGFFVELHLFDTVEGCPSDPRVNFSPGVPYRFYLNLRQSSMSKMYGGADIFVSAEHRAGWSNTTAEAFACGLPVVCTSSGTEDFAVNGKSALVVPLRSSFFIARAVKRLALDPELRKRLSVEARKRIELFSWEKLAEKVERQFLEIVGR